MSRTKVGNKLVGVLALSLLVAVGCSSSDTGGGSTGDVVEVSASGTADFETITEAIDAVPEGSVIRVLPGTYTEKVKLTKNVNVTGSGSSTVVNFIGQSQSFPDESSDSSEAVLELVGVSNVIIQNMRFSGPQDGIIIRNSSNIQLIGVDCSDNGDDGVDVRGSNNISLNGTFSGNGDKGIQVREGSSRVSVENSQLSSNFENGIRIRESSNSSVSQSTITNNGDDGVEVRDSSGVRLMNNRISGNREYGVRIRNAADTTLQGNDIQNNVEGNVRRE